MKDGIDVVVTDYGVVRIGPKVSWWMHEHGLKAGEKLRKGSRKAQYMQWLERSVQFMAEVEWKSGGNLRKTP